MQVRNYEAQDGSKRYVTEVIADEIEFLDSRSAAGEPGFGQGASPSSGGASAQQPSPDSFGPAIPEDEIPF